MRLVVFPTHTEADPEIADGNAFTVIARVAIQPDGKMYVNIVVPAVIPDKSPNSETDATPGALLLHVPPLTTS
jgi:hypothetical protein